VLGHLLAAGVEVGLGEGLQLGNLLIERRDVLLDDVRELLRVRMT